MIRYVGVIFGIILIIALMDSIIAALSSHIMAFAFLAVIIFVGLGALFYLRYRFGQVGGRGGRKY